MLKKISLSSVLLMAGTSTLCANSVAPVVNAEPQMNSRAVEFFVGAAGGAGFLSGKRKETSTFQGGARVIPGSKKLHSNNASFDLYMGAQYNIPKSNLFVDFVPYITFSNLNSTTKGVTFGFTEKETISSRYAVGFDFKPGIKVTANDAFFLSLGGEVRSFKYKHLGTDGTHASAHKNVWAFTFGAGYERTMGKVAVGINLKHRLYQKASLGGADEAGAIKASSIHPNVFTTMLSVKYKI